MSTGDMKPVTSAQPTDNLILLEGPPGQLFPEEVIPRAWFAENLRHAAIFQVYLLRPRL